MSLNWPGGLIRKTPVTPAGPYRDGAAPGVWTLAEATYWVKQDKWPIAGNVRPPAAYLAIAYDASPRVTVYPWYSSGFGAPYTDPATLPTGAGNGVAFSPSGNAIAVATGISPYITAYPWSGSGFGTKYANPATLPTGAGRSIAFSPSGNDIAVGHDTSPYITAYPWSSGFGTKYTDPATPLNSIVRGVAFGAAA